MEYDIKLCVLACAKNEKYSKRLREFVEIYGYKLEDKKLRAKIVFLVEDEPRPDFLDESFGWYNCPGIALSCRLLRYIKEQAVDSHWLMQVDDDSSTDLDKTAELLGQYYDPSDCMLLMGGRNTDLEYGQQNIVRSMKVDNFFFGSSDISKFDTTPYFIHAWEPSIFSSVAIERIKSWPRLDEFYSMCVQRRPTFGDQVPYVAAKLSKVPIVECLFMSPFSKSEEYSAIVPNGRFSHIHYITDKWSGYELFKRRMLASKGIVSPVPKDEKEMWDFWGEENGHKRHIGVIVLNDDKTVGLYKNNNEFYWDSADGKMVFMNNLRQITAVMEKISDDEYAGPFVPNPRVTHRIRKISGSNPI